MSEESDKEKFVAKEINADKKPVEGVTTSSPSLVSSEPVSSEPVDMIANAETAAKRLEAANVQMEQNIKRLERARVQNTLGGSAEAGTVPVTDEQRKDANAKKFLSGTGFEDELFPDK